MRALLSRISSMRARDNDEIFRIRSKAAVEKVWSEGKICVLDIDTQGVRQVKSKPNLESIYVFIKPPSLELLERRLRDRKTDSEESIRRRLKVAESELEYGELSIR